MESTEDNTEGKLVGAVKWLFNRPRWGLVENLPDRLHKAELQVDMQVKSALFDALSEKEFIAERSLAERIRSATRLQRQRSVEASVQEQEDALQTRSSIRRADAKDILRARKALADLRRTASPITQLSRLHTAKNATSWFLISLLVAAMLWSAINVQQQLLPGGTPSDPLFWASFLIEMLISGQLVVLMVGEAMVAPWNVLSEGRWKVVAVDAGLLLFSLAINAGRYAYSGHWYDAALHSVAPLMVGSILVVHAVSAERYGAAIMRAAEQVDPAAVEAALDLAVSVGAERQDVAAPIAIGDRRSAIEADPADRRSPIAGDRSAPIASDRAGEQAEPVSPEETDHAQDEHGDHIDQDDHASRSDGWIRPSPMAIGEQVSGIASKNETPVDRDREPVGATARGAVTSEPIADRAPIADAPIAIGSVVSPIRPTVETEVRAPRSQSAPIADRDRGHGQIVVGSLARDHDRSPIEASDPDRAPWFGTVLSEPECDELAGAVLGGHRSQLPRTELVAIFLASNTQSPTSIARDADKPHSTVLRALKAARKIHDERQEKRRPRLV
ncbi:hypothetical protein AB0N05_37805 [Nocardia sp. NPDC051030]|uniref:hypothetical protein n=1 Tax=Nocardia sp. NPDC051030 TaxID=3155162 RepID=UPI00341BEF38